MATAPLIDRTQTATSFGGHPQKQNYMSRGAVNPKTDITAEQVNALADVAEVSNRMAPLCVLASDSAGNVTFALTRWKDFPVGYALGAAPANAPVVAKTGTGTYKVTFPASITDWKGDTRTVTPLFALGSTTTTTTTNSVVTSISGNVVTVNTYMAGSLSDIGWSIRTW